MPSAPLSKPETPVAVLFIRVATLLLAALTVSCSGIKIETGQTEEEAAASAETQARAIRSDFARQFNRATTVGKAELLIQHVDNTAARYLELGLDLADEWRRGNEGRGQIVPADEFRQVVANSIKKDEPILSAYEDNLEYGLRLIRESGFFDDSFLRLLKSLADSYYDHYSTVFYPAGSVEAYEDSIRKAQAAVQEVSERCRSEIEKYR